MSAPAPSLLAGALSVLTLKPLTAAQLKQLTKLLEEQHAELVALLRELVDLFNENPGRS